MESKKRYTIKTNDINKAIGLVFFIYVCLYILQAIINFIPKASVHNLWIQMGLNIIIFVVPMTVYLKVLDYKKRIKLKTKKRYFRFRDIPFVICISLCVSCFSAILNLILYKIPFIEKTAHNFSSVNFGNDNILLFLAVVIVPAVTEELLLRGAMLSEMEDCSIISCMAVSGLIFALMHSSVFNFFGPFLAGMVYAFLVIIFKSIYPAILAHIINNTFYLYSKDISVFIKKLALGTSADIIVIILFLFLIFITLNQLEKIMQRQIKFIEVRSKNGFIDIIKKPVVWIMILMWFANFIYNIVVSLK